MCRLLAIAALIFACASTARAQEPPGELTLRIGIHSQQSTGRFAGFAGDSGIEPFESYAWANETLCLLSASVREPATIPAVGWVFRGRVLKRTGDEFLVDIEWARLWDHNTRLTNGPKGSMQVTLHVGEPLTLDEVTPTSGGCQVIAARLEAAILPQVRPRRLAGGGGGAGVGSGGAGGGGRGAASGAAAGGIGAGSSQRGSGGGYGGASGGGTTGTPGTSAGARAGGPDLGSGAGDPGSHPVPNPDRLPFALQPWETDRRQFDAEVWLVHKLPSGTEEVQRLTFGFGRTPTRFAFPPIEVIKDGQKGTVDVIGSLYLGSGVRQGLRRTQLIVHLGRTTKKKTTTLGGSFKPVDIPAGNDVLSFVLPVTASSSDPDLQSHFEGHSFSVRLRVTPR